jgi:hypothetical protein
MQTRSTDAIHGIERTGVRFVLTNNADPMRSEDYVEWYDAYEAAITRPGFLANAFRFENPGSAEDEDDPRYAAIYDIVSPDPATAWPDTERSTDYPSYLFDDPRSALVAPVLRATYALAGSLETRRHGALTGATIVLADGPPGESRDQWVADVLETGLFYAASRFWIVNGHPEPPDRLEIFETDQEDPLTAYARLLRVRMPPPVASVRQTYAGSFRLHSTYAPRVAATRRAGQ